MNKFIESFKYIPLLFQIDKYKRGYVKGVIVYKLTEHPKAIRYPKMLVHLYDSKFLTRKDTQDVVFLSTFYERDLTKFLLRKKPKFFCDVGSHIGRFSILMAKNESEVLAIEPSSSNYKQLRINIKLNNLTNIRTIRAGCSNKEGMGKLNLSGSYSGQHTLKGKTNNFEKVNLKKLDNLINKKLDDKDVIKIDVEGFELKVLQGMERILRQQNPVLVVEIMFDEDKKKIKAFLEKFGYYNQHTLDERNFIFEKRDQ